MIIQRVTTSLLLLLATCCLSAQAASPAMSAVRPTGGQRGTEVVVDLTGARLGDAQEVIFFQKGIEVTKIEKVNDNHVKATFKITNEAEPGIYNLRLRTATGVSELRSFSVGLYPEVSEKEPNNDFAAPQEVPLNSVINGVAENEDVDYFIFEAKKGQRVVVDFASRGIDSKLNATVIIADANGRDLLV